MSDKKRVKRRRVWWLAAGVALLCALSLLWKLYPPATWGEPSAVRENDGLTVRFLDVGQGDCALLTTEDTAVLIDTGTVEEPSLAAELVAAYGVTRLNAVVVSHPHSDHIGGLPAVLENVAVDTVYLQDTSADEEFFTRSMRAMDEKHIKREIPKAGDTFSIGAMAFTVLGPLAEAAEDENELSLCLRVEYGARAFLFCGDMTEKEETTLLQLDDGLAADVLKVAHHGSKYSSCRDFLEAVSPKVAVISCGRYNDYGHPTAEAISRLSEAGATVYRTDRQGTVTVTTDGETVSVFCEKAEQFAA